MNEYRIIAVVGKKRSGKDSAGNYLVNKHGFYRSRKLAWPIKQIAMMLFPWTEDMVEGNNYDREQHIDELGLSVRQFLQECGSLFKFDLSRILPEYGKKVGKKIWAKVLVNWIKEQQQPGTYVITDVRFPEEVEELKSNFENVVVLRLCSDRSPVDDHISETSVDLIEADYLIINDGWDTFDEFYEDLDEFVEYIGE